MNYASFAFIKNPFMVESFLGFIAAFALFFSILGAIWYIIQAIAYWRIFSKAGESGWKALIPIYNAYIDFKISWGRLPFFIYLLFVLGGSILQSVGMSNDNNIMIIIGTVLMGISLIIALIQRYKLSEAFGFGIGVAIGLILLQPIFVLILGFGSAIYIGPNGLPERY